MRIHDNWLAQFSPRETAAILSGYSALGYQLNYLKNEACWLARPPLRHTRPN